MEQKACCQTCKNVEKEGICYCCYGVDGVTEISEKFVCANYFPLVDGAVTANAGAVPPAG